MSSSVGKGMDSATLLESMRAKSALLEGHFELSSGLHSDRYFQCALFLQYPEDAGNAALSIARVVRGLNIDVVVGPAMGAVTFSYEVGRACGTRALFTERKDGEMVLRRGFSFKKGERVLVVEDVLTTGGSAREVIAVIESLGAKVVSAGCLVNRSGGNPFEDLNIPLVSLADVEARTWKPSECPLCATGDKAVKPGSRPGA
jgi:orotate phosphoribosyltransferase